MPLIGFDFEIFFKDPCIAKSQTIKENFRFLLSRSFFGSQESINKSLQD